MPKIFRKKSIEVSAIQFTKQNLDDIKAWFPDIKIIMSSCNAIGSNPKEYYIITLEGNMRLNIGDWIIRGVKGEYYPCKPDIFKFTYEEVEEVKDD